MKYIIWGSGIRGRRVFELLGEEKVVAFVDSDASKVGQLYEGIGIYDIVTAEKLYKDCIYVVTPKEHEEEIVQVLINKGIHRYILLGDMCSRVSKNDFFCGYEWDIPKDKCALYGIDLFNILLYEHLKQNIVQDVFLIANDETEKEIVDVLSKEYQIVEKENLSIGIKILVSTVKEKELLSSYGDVECIASVLNRGMPVFNEQLSKFKNIHKGKRAFIVATGPSLRIEDLEKLKKSNEITLSMNRIYNLFSKTGWRPDYYVIQDAKAIEDLADEIAELKLPFKFVSYKPESYWNNKTAVESSIRFRLISEKYKGTMPNFSNDITRGIFEGYTVTYACLQIALYMGFREIYLLGVDFNYSTDLYSAQNHFPGYQSEGRPVRLNEVHPDLVELAYKKARMYGEEHDTEIYNATRGGKLEVFKRIEFDNLF